MQYFVTIYIHPMSLNATTNFSEVLGIPHAFLGLTHTHPDELDSQSNIEIEKYSNPRYDSLIGYYFNTIKKDKGKWYERVYPSILSDEFEGEGFFGFGPVTHDTNHWGKVYENNQYAPESNNVVNEYVEPYYYKERSLSTFWQQNRCVFEISKEQYEVLVESIKKEVRFTQNRNATMQSSDFQLSTSLENMQNTMYYNSTPVNLSISLNWFPNIHNCVTWVLNKLDSIGIEVFNIKEWIPSAPILDDLQEYFAYMRPIHATFRKFQSIDSNLESIKGAKAFRYWARTYLDDSCMRQLYVEEKGINDMSLDEAQKALLIAMSFNIKEVYVIFDKILQSKLDKLNNTQDLQGDFELIYFDKQDKKIKTLKAQNDYEPMEIAEFNLTIPANNCTISKFYPFIFIPKDMMNARVLYHKYDYGKVSQEYQRDRNEFYYNVLAGIQSDKYWSESYHKLYKIQTKG